MARVKRTQRRRRFIGIALVVIGVVLIGLLVVLGYLLFGGKASSVNASGDTGVEAPTSQATAPTEEQIRFDEATAAGAAADDPNVYYLPTPLVATYGDLKIHTPISANHITEIEFHQASYDTALRLTPLVSIVDAQEVAQRHGTNRPPPDEQPTGEQALVAEAVSTWRLDSSGDEMTAVDVGAATGTDVYAPISGTVVKIKSYSLFGQIDDYEIHIQSPDHPELDIVMLHIDDLAVRVGDTVKGGCTRMAKIRDIAVAIDNNLANFTAPDEPGNHCHVQVNDATREGYRGLEDALDIFQ
jgi:biotin carboxyl carrier protein